MPPRAGLVYQGQDERLDTRLAHKPVRDIVLVDPSLNTRGVVGIADARRMGQQVSKGKGISPGMSDGLVASVVTS